MPPVQAAGNGNVHVVPKVVADFVTAGNEDCVSGRIECLRSALPQLRLDRLHFTVQKLDVDDLALVSPRTENEIIKKGYPHVFGSPYVCPP
jgi:hypothetical protein